jgi:DNA-binding transcriptional MerR regulator
MTAKHDAGPAGYRIGAVAKLTGISPDTLRIWERRYGAVTPLRSPGGGRLYDTQDITRLRLMKLLVDAGDSIGAVATLDQRKLEARATTARPVAAPAVVQTPCRVVVIGEPLAVKMMVSQRDLPALELVASYSNASSFLADGRKIEADVLIIEQRTLQAETALQLVDWRGRINAAFAVVVYRFAAQETLQQLPRSRCSTLRAPVDPQTLQSHCVAVTGRRLAGAEGESGPALSAAEPAPSRRYDDETLARLATISTTVRCECPRHLAELITGLGAFEQYNSECESRSPKDAALHAYLHAVASRARHLIEAALDQVVKAEELEL